MMRNISIFKKKFYFGTYIQFCYRILEDKHLRPTLKASINKATLANKFIINEDIDVDKHKLRSQILNILIIKINLSVN